MRPSWTKRGADLTQLNTKASDGRSRIEVLSTEGGLDLDMEKANSLQQDYVEQADFMLDASSRQICAASHRAGTVFIAVLTSAASKALDTTVADFASSSSDLHDHGCPRRSAAKTLMSSLAPPRWMSSMLFS